jgi:hypothetical protein
MAEEYKNPQDPLNAAANRIAEAAKAAAEELTPQEEVAPEAAPAEEIVESIEETPQEEVVAEEESPDSEEAITESEPPTEEDTLEDEETSKEDVIEEDGVISDWDVTGEGDDVEQFDYRSLAQEFGIEAESKDEFAEKVKELKVKADAPDPLADLPENFKKAIDLARNDGDYLEYLGITSVNYDAVADVDMVQNHYAQLYRKPDGSIDKEMLEMKMDSMTEADIIGEGAALKAQYRQQQSQKAADMEAQSARNRELADKALKSELEKLTEHNGFKYSPTHKKQLYDGITSGDMVAKMFHGTDGKMDYKKVIAAYSNYLYGEKQNKYLRQQIATKATKKVLDKLSNKKIEPKGTVVDAKPDRTVLTDQQKFAKELKEQGASLFKQ